MPSRRRLRETLRTNRSAVNRDPQTRDPVRLAHLSDIHFGRIENPKVVDTLVDEVNAEPFTLVVVSGDLTQRAKRHQFRDARAMLDRFTAPVLVVPGNHDVRAWWHQPIERIWRSTRRYEKLITPDLTPTFTAPGLAAFGLNSAHGLTIKGGRIRSEDLAAMEHFFAAQPPMAFRVWVLHHHLLRLEALGDHDVSRGASRGLDAAQRAGVDLVLCGHLHRSHVAAVDVARSGGAHRHRLVVASAGTATSSRGRAENRNVNFYNWIDVQPDRFVVQERRFDADTGRFEAVRETPFART